MYYVVLNTIMANSNGIGHVDYVCDTKKDATKARDNLRRRIKREGGTIPLRIVKVNRLVRQNEFLTGAEVVEES